MPPYDSRWIPNGQALFNNSIGYDMESSSTMKSIVIFGGTGFIGTHLTQTLLNADAAETIYLVDIKDPIDQPYAESLQSGLRQGKVVYVRHDVRKAIPLKLLPGNTD